MAKANNEKKEIEGIEDWNNLYDNATGTNTEFISSDELENGVTVTFCDDNPEEYQSQYGVQLGFNVMDEHKNERVLASSSKRLLGKLANHKKRLGELKGHTFNIVRYGSGFDTKYNVMETKPEGREEE